MSRRVGILISGRGSNMETLVRALHAAPEIAEPVLVVSNNPDAPGLDRARALGVPALGLDHRAHPTREAFDAALDTALQEARVDLVACAGFLRVLSPRMTAPWAGRMLNIHPSLLPLFPGLHTEERALAAGMAVHGCTVHEVTAELDAGPILGQAAVAVAEGDTPETLQARTLVQEHRLYPAVLLAFAADPEAARRRPIALFGAEAP